MASRKNPEIPGLFAGSRIVEIDMKVGCIRNKKRAFFFLADASVHPSEVERAGLDLIAVQADKSSYAGGGPWQRAEAMTYAQIHNFCTVDMPRGRLLQTVVEQVAKPRADFVRSLGSTYLP